MTFTTDNAVTAGPIPASAGIGLRAPHYTEVLAQRPLTAWFEVHSENYFGDGGRPLQVLERIRADYPLSLHGVGLSLGSTDAINTHHLDKLKGLIERFEPGFVSEHLSWSSVEGSYLNDLMPLPYTEEALDHMVTRISMVQEALRRPILIENVSSYLQFRESMIPEWEFLRAVAERAGCYILLDVNNIYVSARNHGFDPITYLRAVPRHLVRELHLAGHTVNQANGHEILIDSHNQPVTNAVWQLYRQAIARFGQVPTLIEWDTDLPPLSELLAEAARADAILEEHRVLSA